MKSAYVTVKPNTVNTMNCIFLLLLLSCCGGFGCGGNGSGRNYYGSNTSSARDGSGDCSNDSALRNGNDIGNSFPPVGSGYDFQGVNSRSGNGNDCGCEENGQGVREASDGNPSHWQDYPGLSRRENGDCDN